MSAKKINYNYEKNIIYIVGLVILAIIIIITIISINRKDINNKNDNEENNIIDESTSFFTEEIENNRIKTLQEMNERDRMEFYVNEFFDYMESDNYDDAYSKLYSEFKENYFPTLDSFEKYARNTFSEMSNIEHDNIERNGDVYVMWFYLKDVINGKPGDESKEMKIVIHENDYGDYELSFSVI